MDPLSQYWLCCKQVSDDNSEGLREVVLSQYWLCCKQVSDRLYSKYQKITRSLNTGFVVSRFLTQSLQRGKQIFICLNTGFVVSRFLTICFGYLVDRKMSQYWLCCKQVSDRLATCKWVRRLCLNTGFVVSRFLTKTK